MLTKKERIVVLAVFVLMLVLTALTPMVADDFTYCFSWADGSRIRHLSQIPASMAVHRALTNGRIIAHALVQLMLINPKLLFNICNALNAAAIFVLLRKYLTLAGERDHWLVLLCGAFLLWNAMPAFGQVFLWLDGSINYSWGATLFLLYLWPYVSACFSAERRKDKHFRIRWLLFAALAFAAGAYSENGSIATLFIALVLTVYAAIRDKRIDLLLLLGLILGFAGYWFLMSAPATGGRGGAFSISFVARSIKYILSLSQDALLPLAIIYGACLSLNLLLGTEKRVILLSVLFVAAGLGSLASFSFAVYFAPRHFFFTVLFWVLSILLLLTALRQAGRDVFPALLAGALAAQFAFCFCGGVLDIGTVYLQSRRREQEIRSALSSGEQNLVTACYSPSTQYSAADGLIDLGEDPAAWPNDGVADYYGLQGIIGVPAADAD